MKIQFLGAAGTVTGSRYLLTHRETRVLIDCGLFQGFKNLRLKNWDPFPIDPKSLDAVIITHAHLDHSGSIPLLVKNGYRGPIYTTPATLSLCEILLPDSGYLQEEEAKFANKHGYSKHHPAKALYNYEEAQASLKYLRPVAWNHKIQISKEGSNPIEFIFFPAGHLLGAASVFVKGNGRTLIFSGDIGRTTDPMIRNPEMNYGADDLIVESTYGDRKHPTDDPETQLRDVILKTFQRNGTLLIPSFAVGRAQLIMYYLNRLKKSGAIPRSVPIYLNSPMATDANKAFAHHIEELKLSPAELQSIWKDVRMVSSADESKTLNEKNERAIIIAASGMATGGRVLHHLKTIAPDPRNTILFAGFQAGGTRGEQMVKGAKEIKIHGQYWPVRAEVISMETLSAHADADEVLDWISSLQKKPKRVFVTHGEPEAADTLRHRISEKFQAETIVPEHGQIVEL